MKKACVAYVEIHITRYDVSVTHLLRIKESKTAEKQGNIIHNDDTMSSVHIVRKNI